MAAEMAAMGVANADEWAEGQIDEDEEPDEVLAIWPENAQAFNVFVRCTWQRTAIADGRLIPTGISAGEVRDVAEMMGLDRDLWPGLLDDVRLMVGAVLPELQRL